MFVHGFLDDAAIWRPLIAALHMPNSQSRAVDLAGMSGCPQEAGPFTLGRYADDVIDVIDGLSGPVVLSPPDPLTFWCIGPWRSCRGRR